MSRNKVRNAHWAFSFLCSSFLQIIEVIWFQTGILQTLLNSHNDWHCKSINSHHYYSIFGFSIFKMCLEIKVWELYPEKSSHPYDLTPFHYQFLKLLSIIFGYCLYFRPQASLWNPVLVIFYSGLWKLRYSTFSHYSAKTRNKHLKRFKNKRN